jgi:transaldolase/glucose-6-phosphate isomerase
MDQNMFAERIWKKDTSLWTSDSTVAEKIKNRLGWVDCVETFEPKLIAIRAFADSVSYSNVVLLGMGGSSLVSRVFDQALPKKNRSFYVLETTDPASILKVQNQIKLDDTLFIVASKSGTTIEVDSLFEYFFNLCPNPQQFIAITDFNTPLMKKAERHKFRHIFINPTDIGGRFAALSYFGLVPFALMGGDVISFLENAKKATEECKLSANNPALELAEKIFTHHQSGRNKLYLDISKPYSALSHWIEQLVAESTGKQGFGIIPILEGKPADDGFTIKLSLFQTEDLAHQFYRWEMATAMVGAMMKINPFDEPNVVFSKQNTGSYLQSNNAANEIKMKIEEIAKSAFEVPAFLKDVNSPEFIAALSYLPNPDKIRTFATQATVPVSICTGPSYLHSTGQLHKGGPNQGRFVIIIDNQEDMPIPGKVYGFQTLKLAQALGDYEALKEAGRKVIMIKV